MGSIILGTVAFSYGSVPMYKMICQTTGWGGQPIKAPGHGGSDDGGDPSTRLRLNAGETVDMPVFFYIDPDSVNDPNMRGIEQVTLSYTFFKARYDNNGQLKPYA